MSQSLAASLAALMRRTRRYGCGASDCLPRTGLGGRQQQGGRRQEGRQGGRRQCGRSLGRHSGASRPTAGDSSTLHFVAQRTGRTGLSGPLTQSLYFKKKKEPPAIDPLSCCDEGERGLWHVGATHRRAILTPPLGTLLQTPPRRAHLALLREILGSRTHVLGGVKVSRLCPPGS